MAVKFTVTFKTPNPLLQAPGKPDKQIVIGTILVNSTNSNVTTGNAVAAAQVGLSAIDNFIVGAVNAATNALSTQVMGAWDGSNVHIYTSTTQGTNAAVATNDAGAYTLPFIAFGDSASVYTATHTPV